MSSAKLYTDEDIHGGVAIQLRRRGYDIVSASEAGNLGLSDEKQMAFAVSQKRAILTFNVRDFCVLHQGYLRSDTTHFGIIVSEQISIGEIVKRCGRLLMALSAEDLVNRLEFLSNWK